MYMYTAKNGLIKAVQYIVCWRSTETLHLSPRVPSSLENYNYKCSVMSAASKWSMRTRMMILMSWKYGGTNAHHENLIFKLLKHVAMFTQEGCLLRQTYSLHMIPDYIRHMPEHSKLSIFSFRTLEFYSIFSGT